MIRRFYMAGRWSNREMIESRAQVLRFHGFAVECRWLTDPKHRMTEDSTSTVFNDDLAQHDIQDLRNSDAIIYNAPAGRRGGCDVEFGMAIALGLSLFWIGPKSHVSLSGC